MPVARTPTVGEIDRAGEIGAAAFKGEPDHWKAAFHRYADRHGLESLIVAEHEGRLVSSMTLIPERMHMGGVEIASAAVAGVGTLPEARRAGAAAAMLEEAVRRLRAWGAVASPMWPFSFAYYRKFGWELGGEARAVTWDSDTAWQMEPRGSVSVTALEDAPALDAVWRAASRHNRCATVREGHHWAHFLGADVHDSGATERAGLLCRQNGEPAAYLLYRVPDTDGKEEAPPVDIVEVRALNAPALAALFYALKDRTDRPRFNAVFSPSDPLRFATVRPRAMETELEAHFGFRVADPPAIFPLLETAAPMEPVHWRVEDALLGGKTWRIAFEGGAAHAEAANLEPDVACTIQTFSQIASGLVKPAAARWAGFLRGDARAVATLQAATAHWDAPFRSGLEKG